MPELEVAGKRWTVAPASNLLDALNAGGCRVPFSCRAGSCHACLVRCLAGEPADARPEALSPAQRAEGWRLSCQCLVVQDLRVEIFDPRRDGIEADVISVDWPATDVLRLRLQDERLHEALEQSGKASALRLIAGVTESIENFVEGAPQSDNITMMCVRYRGSQR